MSLGSNRFVFRVGRQVAAVLLLVVSFAVAGCKTTGSSGPTGLASPRDAAGQTRELTAEDRRAFEDAIAVYEEQLAEGALDLDALQVRFEQTTRRAPRVGEAWYNLGVVYERQGKTTEAEAAYRKALEHKPTLKVAAENLAVLHQNQGKVSEAVDIYHQILTHYPEDAGARARLADLYREQGDHRHARSFAREALVRDSENALAYKVLMLVAVADDDAAAARLLARRAVAFGEEDPEIAYHLARLDLAEGRRDAALSGLRHAASLRADYAAPRLVLAKMAMEQEDWVTASTLYREVLAYHEDLVGAWLNLGVALRGLGHHDEAAEAYERVLALDGGMAAAHFNLGVLKFRAQADPAAGLEHLRTFVSASRGLPRDHVAYTLINEAEETIRMEEEMRRMEEQMRREEEAAQREAERAAREAEEEAAAAAASAAEEESAPAEEGVDAEAGDDSAEPDAPGEV